MLFSHRILKKIIKENKSDRQIYNIPGDIRYDYYKENESWYAIDKDRNNLILDLSKYPSAVDKLNRYFPDATPPSVDTQPPTRSNPGYIEGDSKYKYFIDNDTWYAINVINNNEIDLSRNEAAIDILNREFETDIVVKDDVKPAYINPNAVTKYSYPASNSKLIEDEELMEIMLDFAVAEDLSWGAFIRKRNPGVEKKYVGIMEKSGGYPIYSAELHEYSTRLNDIEGQFPPEVKRVFKNEGYKVNDLANRSKRSKIYDKVKEQYEENARRVNPPVRFIDLFDSRGVMKEKYRPINLKDLPEKLTNYAAEQGRSDVNVTSNGIVRSISKVVYNTLSSRSNLSLHLFGLKHDIKITTNPPMRDDSLLAFKDTLLDDESDLGVLPENKLRLVIKNLILENEAQSLLSSARFQKMENLKFSKKEKALPERGIDEEFFKFILTDDSDNISTVYALTVSGDVYIKDNNNNQFKKVDISTKDTNTGYASSYSNIEMTSLVKRFIDNIDVAETQAPGISKAINNTEAKFTSNKKQTDTAKSDNRRLQVMKSWPVIKDFVYQYKNSGEYYIKGNMRDKLVKQHKALAKDLESHLQANGFPETEIIGGSGGRNLEEAAATDNPDRIPGTLHGFNLAVDFKINCPEAGVDNYRQNTDGKKGIKNNPKLAKNSKLVKQIYEFMKGQTEYRWGGTFGKKNPANGEVSGRGITEFHHFEIAPEKLTSYLDQQVKDVMKHYGFEPGDIKNSTKRAELYRKLLLDYFEGSHTMQGKETIKKIKQPRKKAVAKK